MVEDLLTFDKAKLYCNLLISNIISVYYKKKKVKEKKKKKIDLCLNIRGGKQQ